MQMLYMLRYMLMLVLYLFIPNIDASVVLNASVVLDASVLLDISVVLDASVILDVTL